MELFPCVSTSLNAILKLRVKKMLSKDSLMCSYLETFKFVFIIPIDLDILFLSILYDRTSFY